MSAAVGFIAVGFLLGVALMAAMNELRE